jgi:uncharacterized membrane protein
VNLAVAASASAGVRATALVVLAVAGLGLAVIGYLGWRVRLPRNRFAGVRTPTAMRSDDTFRVANQVAGVPVMVAGLVGVFGGVAAFFLPSAAATVTTLVIVVLGMGGLAVAGGVLGNRAAGVLLAASAGKSTSAVPSAASAGKSTSAGAPESQGGCAGCCCGGCG